MTLPALTIQNLCCQIGAKTIVENVSFTVAAGEFVSILGPNGAGKTTLLKCLNRILHASAGTVAVNGRELNEYSQSELAREIGYVPQGGTDEVPFSVFEFVMLGRYPHLSPFSSPTAKDEEAVVTALKMAGADNLLERACSTLSGGERQRVLIAGALAQEAKILLLDEPTTFLDPHHQHDILKLLAGLNRDSGVTVLAVTHDINAAALISDRVLALRAGQRVFAGTPDELMTGPVLNDIFGQDFQFVTHPGNGRRIIIPEAVR